MNRAASMGRSQWSGVVARTLAAIPLNYGVTTALTMLVARLLPGGTLQASIGATLLSFAIFGAIVMLSFAVRSVAKLWVILVGVGLGAGTLDWLLIAWGGRL